MNDKELLREILLRGFDHLSALTNALARIQKEAKDDEESLKQSVALSMVFRALNDVLHPGYATAQTLFPQQDMTPFLDMLNKAHKEAVDKKIFPVCTCSSCKVTDESTPRNTDQD